jgi:hypothetical protein
MTVQWHRPGSSRHAEPRRARGWRLLQVAFACSLLGCTTFSDRFRDKAIEAQGRKQPDIAAANYDRAVDVYEGDREGPVFRDLVAERDNATRIWVRAELAAALAGMSEKNVAERLTRIRSARKTADKGDLGDVRAEADAAAEKALPLVVEVIKALTEAGELNEAFLQAHALRALKPPLTARAAEIAALEEDARAKAQRAYMKQLEELNADPQSDDAAKWLVTRMAKFYGATVPDADRSKLDYEAFIGWTVTMIGCSDLSEWVQKKFAERDAAVKGSLDLRLECNKWDRIERTSRTMTVYDTVSRTVHVPSRSCVRKPATFHGSYETTENNQRIQRNIVSQSEETCYNTSSDVEETEQVPRQVEVESSYRDVGYQIDGKISVRVPAFKISESKPIKVRYAVGAETSKPSPSLELTFSALRDAGKEIDAVYSTAMTPLVLGHLERAREHSAAGRMKDAQREYVLAALGGGGTDLPRELAGFVTSRYRMTTADFESFVGTGEPREFSFDGGSLVQPSPDAEINKDYKQEIDTQYRFRGQNGIRAGLRVSGAGLTAYLPEQRGESAFGFGLGLALGVGNAFGKTFGFAWDARLAIGGKKAATDAFATDASLMMGPGLRLPFLGLYGLGGMTMDYLGGDSNSAIVPLGVAFGYGGRLVLASAGSWTLDLTGLRYARVAATTPDDPINAITTIYKGELLLRLRDEDKDAMPWAFGAFWHGHMARGEAPSPGVVSPEELRSMAVGGSFGIGY